MDKSDKPRSGDVRALAPDHHQTALVGQIALERAALKVAMSQLAVARAQAQMQANAITQGRSR